MALRLTTAGTQALTEALEDVRKTGVPSGFEPSRVISLQNLDGVGDDELLGVMTRFGEVTHYVITPPLSSAMVIYATQEEAELAFEYLHGREEAGKGWWGGEEGEDGEEDGENGLDEDEVAVLEEAAAMGVEVPQFMCRFGKAPRLSDEELSKLLLIPPHKTNFLISPPPSPPDTWIPGPEDGPNGDQAPDADVPVVVAPDRVLIYSSSQNSVVGEGEGEGEGSSLPAHISIPDIHFEPAS